MFRSFLGNGFLLLAAIGLLTTQVGNTLAQEKSDVTESDTTESKETLSVKNLPELPFGITSFGAAACDNALFVYGGHRGAAHHYYREGQNQKLLKLDLDDPGEWTEVAELSGRQGLAMVSHDNKLYMLGGFEASNAQDEDQVLNSTTDFNRFDPATGESTELLAMPERRSSFDAVVMGDTLYIVGGWNIEAGKKNVWSKTAWSIDLSDLKAEWEALPEPPFQRRALSTTHQNGKLVVIGGMQEVGGPTREVAIYDPETKAWASGPDLPGEDGMEGFGNSSFNVGGQVCISTYGGHVYKMNEGMNGWDEIGLLETGRFFHRLLPVSDDRFALIGGANMGTGKILKVEEISR